MALKAEKSDKAILVVFFFSLRLNIILLLPLSFLIS